MKRIILFCLFLSGCGQVNERFSNGGSVNNNKDGEGGGGGGGSQDGTSGILLQDLVLKNPSSWEIAQRVQDESTIIIRFKKGDENFSIYVKRAEGNTLQSTFAEKADIVSQETVQTYNNINWKTITTSVSFAALNQKSFIAGFMYEKNGFTYFGFSRNPNQSTAEAATKEFLNLAKFKN